MRLYAASVLIILCLSIWAGYTYPPGPGWIAKVIGVICGGLAGTTGYLLLSGAAVLLWKTLLYVFGFEL
jgi:hypothetical protein